MKFLFYIFLLLLPFCFSCTKTRDVLILQGDFVDSTKNHSINYDIIIEKNDLLEINLISSNEEASNLFKDKLSTQRTIVTYSSGIPVKGFLVDSDGNISLPLVGKIKVSGKYRNQIIDEIQEVLKEYLKDPIIQVNLLNFKVSIIGEVKNPGTFNIPNEKINIIQLLGICGDVTTYGNRKEIIVFRENNGVRKEIHVNLNDKSVFLSEAFYLKQNDVVYIPPMKSKVFNLNNQLFIPFVSVASLILTALNLFLNI